MISPLRHSAATMIVAILLAATGGSGSLRHTRRVVATMPPPDAHRFYPEQVPGGVSGNLPFNNQLRKFSDPLSANGGR